MGRKLTIFSWGVAVAICDMLAANNSAHADVRRAKLLILSSNDKTTSVTMSVEGASFFLVEIAA
jgi:hypothetical protein